MEHKCFSNKGKAVHQEHKANKKNVCQKYNMEI